MGPIRFEQVYRADVHSHPCLELLDAGGQACCRVNRSRVQVHTSWESPWGGASGSSWTGSRIVKAGPAVKPVRGGVGRREPYGGRGPGPPARRCGGDQLTAASGATVAPAGTWGRIRCRGGQVAFQETEVEGRLSANRQQGLDDARGLSPVVPHDAVERLHGDAVRGALEQIRGEVDARHGLVQLVEHLSLPRSADGLLQHREEGDQVRKPLAGELPQGPGAGPPGPACSTTHRARRGGPLAEAPASR